MNKLTELLEEIKYQKETYIIPENLRAGITALGVKGILEAGDNNSIKVFNTVEEMRAVEDGQEGDLAIIYGYRWTEMDPCLAFNAMEFSDTIELTNPIEDWANYCYFAPAAYETENSASVAISYDVSTITVRFRMDATAAEETFITYTSTDGLFFTADRTDNRILTLPNDVMATSLDVWLLDHNKIARINAKTADIYMFYEDYGMTGWENISNTTNSQGIDTSDATAMAENIEPGYCAYTKDGLVYGNMNVAEGMTFNSEYDKDKPEYRIFYNEDSNNIEQIFRNDKKVLLVDGTELDIRVSGADIVDVIGLTSNQILAGNTVLGLEGTAEIGGEDSGIKLFNTKEEMQEDSNVNYGDLAVVYDNYEYPVAEGAQFSTVVFPETVVLDTAIEKYNEIYINFGPVDTTKYGTGWGGGYYYISDSGASFGVEISEASDGYDEPKTLGSFYASYTSEDGLTYKLNSVTGSNVINNEAKLPCLIKITSSWKDIYSKFIYIKNNSFEGLYSYGKDSITTKDIYAYDYSKLKVSNNRITGVDLSSKVISIAEIEDILNHTPFYSTNYVSAMVAYADNMYYIVPTRSTGNPDSGLVFVYNITDNKLYVAANQVNTSSINQPYADIYIYNPSSGETIQTTLADYTESLDKFSYNPKYEKIAEINDRENAYITFYKSDATLGFTRLGYYTIDEAASTNSVGTYTLTQNFYKYDAYVPALTQLTAKPDFVYKDDIFYGEKGVETGTLLSSYSNNFNDAATDIFMEIQNAYDNMEPFMCTNSVKPNAGIRIFPSKTDGTPLINVSQVTNFEQYFLGYEALEKVMSIDFSNVRYCDRMFAGCSNLTYICDLDFSGATSSITGLFINNWKLIKAPFIKLSDKVSSVQQMFDACRGLIEIPEGMDFSHVKTANWFCAESSALESFPDFKFNSLTSTKYMFNKCTALKNIVAFNFDKVTDAEGMFNNCPNLSDETLNNILGMCATNSLLATKTLAYLGLTSEQATRCTSLSNYQTFVDAGWTTGY